MSLLSYSQNRQLLYDFANVPQKLLINPGAEINNKFYIGIPLLSHISLQGGVTAFSAYDIFADDGIPINDKIRKAVNNYGKTEFTYANEQLEILSGGLRLKNNNYLSFGLYQEFDFLAKVPKDLIDLYYEGNTIINKHYSIEKLSARSEVTGVFHVGLSKKINNKWLVGARAKLYSSVYNAKTKKNSGYLTTQYGTDNIYVQKLQNINFLLQTSGVFLDDYDDVTPSYITGKMFLGGNLGLGFDVGFTHYLTKQWKVSGSVQDIGFTINSKDVETYEINNGYFETEGIQLYFDPNKPEDYWQNLRDDFNDKVVLDTLYTGYVSLKPLKLNGAVSYSFGRPFFEDCRFYDDEIAYTDKVGLHVFSMVSDIHSYLAATLFYEKRLNKSFYSKITYTVDPFSFSNIGVGFSANIGKFNTYFLADNLLNLRNVYDSKSVNFQLGFNVIFQNKN